MNRDKLDISELLRGIYQKTVFIRVHLWLNSICNKVVLNKNLVKQYADQIHFHTRRKKAALTI
jgi:hypothetical protein